MRKFRLIKKYPGSPELGSILTGSDENCRAFPTEKCMESNPEFWEEVVELCVPIGTKFTKIKDDIIFTIDSIEDNKVIIKWEDQSSWAFIENVNTLFKNGFWKVYEEKDYEILSFKHPQDNGETWGITRKIASGRYLNQKYSEKDLPFTNTTGDGMGATLDYMLNDWVESAYDKCLINSIKRLSDNSIFTIGDRILRTDINDKYTIEKFEIQDNELKVYLIGMCVGISIDNIQKIKDPIFITEDGVDIYDSEQIVYWTYPNYFITHPMKAINAAKKIKGGTTYLFFSSEKAIKNYIKLHKLVLSYNDVLSMFTKIADEDDWGVVNRTDFKEKLTELVKSKIK